MGPPNWVYFTCVLSHPSVKSELGNTASNTSRTMHRWAAGLFLYQTFDAIDGCVSILQSAMKWDAELMDGWGRLG